MFGLSSAQAPGDEDVAQCIVNQTYTHTYPDNWRVLMDSWNYEQLLPGHSGLPIAGAVWTDASCDTNDNTQHPNITPPYVSVHVIHHSTSCTSQCVSSLPVAAWWWRDMSISGTCVWIQYGTPGQLALHSAHLKGCASH